MTTRTGTRGRGREVKAQPRSLTLRSQIDALFQSLGRSLLRASRAHDGPKPETALPHLRRAARAILSVTDPR